MRCGLLVVVLLLTPAAEPSPAPPTDVEKLTALARLYGVVRWFHPSDAARELDWNRFAVHAARSVRAARTRDEVQRSLESLVAPIGAGIVIGAALPAPVPGASPSGARLVAWRHRGMGFGGEGGAGAYVSARTHRPERPAIDGFATLMQTVPAERWRGRTVRFAAKAKAEAAGAEGAGLWLRVDRPAGVGFFDNMSDRPIQTTEWREYAIEGVVDADAMQLAIGVIARGRVRAGFDAASLSVKGTDGSWQPITIQDPGFEAAEAWRRSGTSRNVVVSYETDAPPEGHRYLVLAPPKEPAAPPFEAPLHGGAAAEVELGLGLRARVPLVLADEEAAPGATHLGALSALRAELARPLPAGEAPDADVRVADVIVAWNVYRHFYPYWPEVGLDWDSRLPPLLAAALARSREGYRDALRRLVAEVRDGHGGVNDPGASHNARLPIAVRWLEGRLIVTASEAPEQVRVGDLITAVDGRPAGAWFAQQEALTSGSPQWRTVRALQALEFAPEGRRVALVLERRGGGAQVELSYARREPARERRPDRVVEIRPRVWYVDLDRADWAAIEPRLPDLAKARAVVFDLRGYPSDAGYKILPHLLSAPEHDRWMHVPQITEPFGRFAAWDDFGWSMKPASPRIAGRVAFLTDGRAISYAESVMGYVEALRLGAIVGGLTAGTNGNVNVFMVPSGLTIAFTGMRVTRHDGSTFHLAGVRPTVPVEPTLAGIRAGRDEVLERALAELGVNR